ncbi:MAG TPA: hypothetical protein PLX89_09585 [Verrucomicrobiota bacterium]|nr:hypothetical protein [Verrucomicrobiota bacterium]
MGNLLAMEMGQVIPATEDELEVAQKHSQHPVFRQMSLDATNARGNSTSSSYEQLQ